MKRNQGKRTLLKENRTASKWMRSMIFSGKRLDGDMSGDEEGTGSLISHFALLCKISFFKQTTDQSRSPVSFGQI